MVGQENLAIVLEVADDLLAVLEEGEFFVQRLDLDDAALGLELEKGGRIDAVFLQMLDGKDPAIGNAGTGIRRMDDGTNLGFQAVAYGVEELGECRVARGFRNADSGDLIKFCKIRRYRMLHDGRILAAIEDAARRFAGGMGSDSEGTGSHPRKEA